MNFHYTALNESVGDAVKNRCEAKLGKLDKLLPKGADVHITFVSEKNSQKIEATIPLNKRILRAEVSDTDLFSAIDSLVDVLDKQIEKYKHRLKDKSRRDVTFKDEFDNFGEEHENLKEEHLKKIERTKRFALKPMDAEEAVMEMELLGHNFYVFRSGETDEVNVVYKRKNGSYGLIEPEY